MLNPKGRNWGPLINWDTLAKFYASFAIAWTTLLLLGILFLVFHRSHPYLRMRNLPLAVAATTLLHIYLVKILLAYTTNGHFLCSVEFWIMSIYLPGGIALFQANVVQLERVVGGQRALLEGGWRRGLRRKSGGGGKWLGAWREMDKVRQTYVVIGIGMTLQVVMTAVIYATSPKLQGHWGKIDYPTGQRLCRKGPEWIPSSFWQLFWSCIYGPYLLFKIRHVHDTHHWRLQVFLSVIFGIPGTPLWLAAVFSPAFKAPNKYFVPPMWLAPGIIVMQFVTIFFPIYDYRTGTHLSKSTLAALERWESASSSGSSTESTSAESKSGESTSNTSNASGSHASTNHSVGTVGTVGTAQASQWSNSTTLRSYATGLPSSQKSLGLGSSSPVVRITDVNSHYHLAKPPPPPPPIIDFTSSKAYTMLSLTTYLSSPTRSHSLLHYAATQDFTAENILFLRAVAEWKGGWLEGTRRVRIGKGEEVLGMHTPTDTGVVKSVSGKCHAIGKRREMFLRGREIYETWIASDGDACEWQVNVEWRVRRGLDGVFGEKKERADDRVGRILSPLPLQPPRSRSRLTRRRRIGEGEEGAGRGGVGDDYGFGDGDGDGDEYPLSPLEPPVGIGGEMSGRGSEATDEGYFDGGADEEECENGDGDGDEMIPDSFDEKVFDVAEKSVLYLVCTNTWRKYVTEMRKRMVVGGEGGRRSGEEMI